MLIMVAKYSNKGTQSGMIFEWLNKTFHKLGKGHHSSIFSRLEVMRSMILFLFVFNTVCVTISLFLVVISYHNMGIFILRLLRSMRYYFNASTLPVPCHFFQGLSQRVKAE